MQLVTRQFKPEFRRRCYANGSKHSTICGLSLANATADPLIVSMSFQSHVRLGMYPDTQITGFLTHEGVETMDMDIDTGTHLTRSS